MRSKLFVPGSRPELFHKALNSEADGISFDLEDAVAESKKEEARLNLAQFLADVPETNKTLIVRVNAQDSAHHLKDLKALVKTKVNVINLPKVESAAHIINLVEQLESLECEYARDTKLLILANIESPKGLRCAAEIATAHPRVMGLQLGFADLLEPLGIDRQDKSTIRQIQLAVRLASGEAGIATFDSAFANIKDTDGFYDEAKYGRALGFSGKSCIHPSQITAANKAFLPSEEEISQSLKILNAAADADRQGLGAYQVDGKMIDAPFVRRAQDVINQAKQAGLVSF